MLNPDWDSAAWSAFGDPIECTYGHPERKNCWKIIYRITVMPNADSKAIECEWLVDMDSMQYQALNTEARAMFDGV